MIDFQSVFYVLGLCTLIGLAIFLAEICVYRHADRARRRAVNQWNVSTK
jgi:hypothetical protein